MKEKTGRPVNKQDLSGSSDEEMDEKKVKHLSYRPNYVIYESMPNNQQKYFYCVLYFPLTCTDKGIELGITTTNIQTSDFKWTSIFNFNLIRSLVLDAGPTGEIFLGGTGFSSLGTIIRKGEQFGQIFGSRNARSETGALLIDKNTGLPFEKPESEIIGNPNPDFTLGFINNFSYKGFSVSALLDYRHGGDMYSVTAASLLLRGQLNNEYAVDREGVRIIPGVYGNPSTFAAVKDASGAEIKNTTPMTAFD